MKRIFSFIVAISIATTIMGQVPESFKYQSVLRNSRGDVRANTATTIMIDILQGSSTGTTVFSETHHVTTDNFGLINLEIGRGESRVGSMSSIDWRLGSYFIKTTVDDIEMGTSQLLSVPYALHAKTAEQVSGTARETDPVFITSPAIKITTTDVGNWASAYNWGNHATAGYLKSLVETDPYVAAINGLVKSNGFTISAAIAGTDYLTRSDSAANVTGIVSGANGGTGIDNRGKTISLGGNLTTSGAFPTTLISTANTNITLPASGTLATLAGFEALSNKTINNLTPYALAAGFSIKGGTIASKTLTVIQDASVSGTNTGDQDLTGLTHTNRSALDLVSGTNTGDQTLSGLGGVAANSAITGATKTKITYDAKGLVTAGTDATTADIAPSTDRKYLTDAEKVVIGNTSGTNTGDQDLTGLTHTNRSSLDLVSGTNTGDQTNVTGTVAIANGGTGAATQQAAINALAGAVTDKSFLRGNGTNVTLSAIQVADVPTLNQNTTGTAANVTGTVAIANGGTGSTTQNFVDLTTTQTITGAKTFDNSMLALKGTSTGKTTLSTANASATDYTVTLPAATGTVALTSGATTDFTGSLAGDITGTQGATTIASGVIVNADVNASAAIADTKLATIETAGKVSNSATTATNANTASANTTK